MSDLFWESGISNPREKAVHLYATMFFFYSMYDGAEDKKKMKQELEKMLDGQMKKLYENETGEKI